MTGEIDMNETIKTIINHLSVRKFKEQSLTERQIKLLVQAAQSASISSYNQAYSIIGLTEKRINYQK